MSVNTFLISSRGIILAYTLIGTVCAPLSAVADSKTEHAVVPVSELARRISDSQKSAAQRAAKQNNDRSNVESAVQAPSAAQATSTGQVNNASANQSKPASTDQSKPVSANELKASADQSNAASAAEAGSANESKSASANQAQVSSVSETQRPDKISAARNEANLLKGAVTQTSQKSPLLYDDVQEMPTGTTINLVSLANINSEINRKGDDVWVRVGSDVHGASQVAMPGGWYMHGLVTEAAPSRRGGRDGYVTIQFDKLVSPDKQIEVPFDAHISSKPSLGKAVAKNVLIGSGHVTLGALGGSIMAVQFGGLGTAIATHGISVGVGAGIGATIGLIGAVKRKGSISQITPGDDMKMVIATPISLPGFDASLIPSAKPIAKLQNFEVLINKAAFSKDPYGDTSSQLLTVDLTVNNRTAREYGFSQMAVVSDREQYYYPDGLLNGVGTFVKKKVKPNSSENAVVAFNVGGKQHKYWLVLLDPANQHELNRIPIN